MGTESPSAGGPVTPETIQTYLAGYGPDLQAQALELVTRNRLGDYLRARYEPAHEVRSDKALFQAAVDLKHQFLRTAPPLTKVIYDSRLQVLSQALGQHTAISRVQGSRLKASREIRVDAVFRQAPAAFLRMILVHELAHLRERTHNKAFYQLCTHMEPDYFQLELDLRLYLVALDCGQIQPEQVAHAL